MFLLVLPRRPVPHLQRLRGAAAGQHPLRGRALHRGLSGLHGGRCDHRRRRREQNPRGSEAPL